MPHWVALKIVVNDTELDEEIEITLCEKPLSNLISRFYAHNDLWLMRLMKNISDARCTLMFNDCFTYSDAGCIRSDRVTDDRSTFLANVCVFFRSISLEYCFHTLSFIVIAKRSYGVDCLQKHLVAKHLFGTRLFKSVNDSRALTESH